MKTINVFSPGEWVKVKKLGRIGTIILASIDVYRVELRRRRTDPRPQRPGKPEYIDVLPHQIVPHTAKWMR